jgi:hypothetical protein
MLFHPFEPVNHQIAEQVSPNRSDNPERFTVAPQDSIEFNEEVPPRKCEFHRIKILLS